MERRASAPPVLESRLERRVSFKVVSPTGTVEILRSVKLDEDEEDNEDDDGSLTRTADADNTLEDVPVDSLLNELAQVDQEMNKELAEKRSVVFEQVVPTICTSGQCSRFQNLPLELALQVDSPFLLAKTTGDIAPDFTLTSTKGVQFSLHETLERAPFVMVNFWRGNWCPFCEIQIRASNKAYKGIKRKGCAIVFVSPQNMEKTNELVQRMEPTSLVFLTDPKLQACKSYGLDYRLPDVIRNDIYADRMNIKWKDYYDEEDTHIPLAATYVIAPERDPVTSEVRGRIIHTYVGTDFTKRESLEEAAISMLRYTAVASSEPHRKSFLKKALAERSANKSRGRKTIQPVVKCKFQ